MLRLCCGQPTQGCIRYVHAFQAVNQPGKNCLSINVKFPSQGAVAGPEHFQLPHVRSGFPEFLTDFQTYIEGIVQDDPEIFHLFHTGDRGPVTKKYLRPGV